MTTRTDGTPVDLLSRIDALEAQLKAKADEIERLKGRTGAASAPREDPGAHEATAERSGEEHGVSRREWLMKGAAGVAATALAATDAMAQTRTTAWRARAASRTIAFWRCPVAVRQRADDVPAGARGQFFGVIGLITGAAPTRTGSAGSGEPVQQRWRAGLHDERHGVAAGHRTATVCAAKYWERRRATRSPWTG